MKNCYYKLEYDKILQILSTYCKTDIGKNIALNLLPSNNSLEVKHLLKETSEALIVTSKAGTPPICFLPNIDCTGRNWKNFKSIERIKRLFS